MVDALGLEGKALPPIDGAAWIDDNLAGVAPSQGKVRESLEGGTGKDRTAGVVAAAVAGALQAPVILVDQAAKMRTDGRERIVAASVLQEVRTRGGDVEGSVQQRRRSGWHRGRGQGRSGQWRGHKAHPGVRGHERGRAYGATGKQFQQAAASTGFVGERSGFSHVPVQWSSGVGMAFVAGT